MGLGDEQIAVKVTAEADQLRASMRASSESVAGLATVVEAASRTINAAMARAATGATTAHRQSAAAAKSFADAYAAAVESVQDRAGVMQRAYQATIASAARFGQQQQQLGQAVQATWRGIATAAQERDRQLTAGVQATWGGLAAAASSYGARFEQTMFRAGQVAGGALRGVVSVGQAAASTFGALGFGAIVLNQGLSLVERTVRGVLGVLDVTVGATARQGDAWLELSRRLQTPVEELSRIGYAAEQAGVPVETLGKVYAAQARAIAEAAHEGTEAQRIFAEGLGLSVAEILALQQLSPDQAMFRLAEAFDRTADGAQKTADMSAVFGQGFASVLVLLREGRDEFERNKRAADALGATWSGPSAAAANRLNSALGTVGASLAGVVKRVVEDSGAMGPLAAIAERLAERLAAIGRNIPADRLEAMRRALVRAADAAVDFVTRGVTKLLERLPGVVAWLGDLAANAERFAHAIGFVLKGAAAGAVAGAFTPLGPVGGAVVGGTIAAASAGTVNPIPTVADQERQAADVVARHNRELDHRARAYDQLVAAAERAGNAARAADLRSQRDRVVAQRVSPGEAGTSDARGPAGLHGPDPRVGGGSALPVATLGPTRDARPSYGRTTGADESAADRAAAEAKRTEKELLDRLQRRKQLELDAAQDSAAARLAIEERYTRELGQRFGQQSEAYERQLHEQNQAARDATAERVRTQAIEIAAKRDHALAELDLQRERDEAQRAAGAITEREMLDRLRAYYDERRAIILNALDAEAALAPQTPEQQAESGARRQQATDERDAGVQGVDLRAEQFGIAADLTALWGETWRGIEMQTTRAIQGMVNGGQRFGQAMRNMSRAVLADFVGMGARMVARWAFDLLKMGIAYVAYETLKTTNVASHTAIRSSIEKTASASSLLRLAAQAAGGAYSSASQIPYVGWILGPIAAAAAFAAVLAFGASAEGGWGEVPHDGAVGILHKKEMVLPAPLAQGIRELITNRGTVARAPVAFQMPSLDVPIVAPSAASRTTARATEGDDDGGDPALAGGGAGGGATIINIHAQDAASFEAFLRRPGNAAVLARHLRETARLSQRRV